MDSEEFILALQREIAELRLQVEALRRKNAMLKDRLNKNSRNSSKSSFSNVLLDAPVANRDETGTGVSDGICWLHSACNGNYTCLSMQEKRGREKMEKAGILPSYTGIIIHDAARRSPAS